MFCKIMSVIKMEIFDTMILDIILVALPLTVYLLYLAYTKTFNKKENDLLIIVTIFTILYLLFKYTKPLYMNMPFMIINISLIIAYIKKSKISIFVTSVIMVIYYYSFYQNYFPIIILEYLLYYLFYLKLHKEFKVHDFILTFTTIKIVITLVLLSYLNYAFPVYVSEVLIEGIYMYVVANIIIYFLNKTEEVLKLHMSIKEIKHNEQIHTSLFQITHEIKNPIAVCKGYLDMFDSENPKHFKKYIPILKDEINRTLLLLEDFLAMNKVKINKDIIDINLLIEEVIKNIDMLCQKNNIQLTSKIIDDDIYINADYNRLTQVFINLLKNSIEAIPKDKNGKIIVHDRIKENYIIITINDNGKGMSKELLNKIKEPFYTTKQRGTGLGVSLSDQIIKAHNGTLSYESKEGEYTKVTITLPLEEY